MTTVLYYATIAALDFVNFNPNFFNDLLQRKIPSYADAPEVGNVVPSKQDFFSLISRDHPEIYEQGLFEPVFAGASTDTFSKKNKEN